MPENWEENRISLFKTDGQKMRHPFLADMKLFNLIYKRKVPKKISPQPIVNLQVHLQKLELNIELVYLKRMQKSVHVIQLNCGMMSSETIIGNNMSTQND